MERNGSYRMGIVRLGSQGEYSLGSFRNVTVRQSWLVRFSSVFESQASLRQSGKVVLSKVKARIVSELYVLAVMERKV